MEAESSVKFSPAEREAVLEVLEKCVDSLVVYHNTLRQQPEMRSDTANFYPEIEYVKPKKSKEKKINIITVSPCISICRISETSILQSFIGNFAKMTNSRREAVREKLQRERLFI